MDHSEVKHLPKVDHTPAELDEVSQLLLRAAALIEDHGWSNGCLEDHEGKHCVEGAIHKCATGHYAKESAIGDAAKKRITDYFKVRFASTWNNCASGGEEVIAGVRKIALGL